MKILIIGAGVAGLATALALKQNGHQVEVFDRVTPPSMPAPGSPWIPADIGGGIQINENALRALKRLGILNEVMAAGVQVRRHELAKFDGYAFAGFNTYDKGEFITTCILRSAMAKVMNSALNRSGVFMKAGKKLAWIEQPSDGKLGVTAHFEDGTSAYGDILVGADGVNSATRNLLFPEVTPKRSNYYGYFAVSPLNGDSAPTVFTIMVDAATGNYAFVMPCGDTMVHWGLFESRPQANEDVSWDMTGDLVIERERMLALTEKWKLPKGFHRMVQNTSRVIRVRFTSVPPMPAWHKHNCVLIGDASHGLMPFIGQGAGMCLEDAISLPLLLDKLADNPSRAFELFRELRTPRVEKVAATSEALGDRISGSSPTTAAVGHFLMKIFAFIARVFHLSYFADEIVRYDPCDAAEKFVASKGL
ncbi:hypothetical protein HK405_014899 [Cladochytrium tenue]|nr:hypothetical protein HK405_014899 [Cladochytrium tenue]